MPSTVARRMSASIGSRVGTLPEVLADLTGPLGDRVRTGLLETSIITQLGGSLRQIRDTWRASKEAMGGIVPESWLEWGLGEEGDRAPRSQRPTCWLRTTPLPLTPAEAQQKLGKLVNQGKHAAHTASLDQLPDTARPSGPGDP